MSLVAVWNNEEEGSSIWVATDSRISGQGGPLLDEGGKLFSLPVVCRGPSEEGFFHTPYHAQELGLACVGGSLVYQHIYACLIPVLTNLNGLPPQVPSLEDIAGGVARVSTKYVSAVGKNLMAGFEVGLALMGYCVVHGRQEAYSFEPMFGEGSFQQIRLLSSPAVSLTSSAMRFLMRRPHSPQLARQPSQLVNIRLSGTEPRSACFGHLSTTRTGRQ